MKVKYDKNARAIYVELFTDGKYSHTEELVKDEINIDYTEEMDVIGIEILGVDNIEDITKLETQIL